MIDATVKNANLKEILEQGRKIQAEELNVTRLIATSRGHQTMQLNLIPDPKNQKLVSMRMIKLNATKDKESMGEEATLK